MSQIDGKEPNPPTRKIHDDVELVEGDNLGGEDGLSNPEDLHDVDQSGEKHIEKNNYFFCRSPFNEHIQCLMRYF